MTLRIADRLRLAADRIREQAEELDRLDVVTLRGRGLTYDQVAERLGMTRGRVTRLARDVRIQERAQERLRRKR